MDDFELGSTDYVTITLRLAPLAGRIFRVLENTTGYRYSLHL